MAHPESGETFLHERDPRFHNSREVGDIAAYLRAGGDRIPNEPSAKLGARLKFLREVVGDGILTGDSTSIDRQVEAHVIAPDDVPESYFATQIRIARDQGHGNVELTPAVRRATIRTLQDDQRESLHEWADYLSDESNQGIYPDWLKTYAWESR